MFIVLLEEREKELAFEMIHKITVLLYNYLHFSGTCGIDETPGKVNFLLILLNIVKLCCISMNIAQASDIIPDRDIN